MACCSRRFPLEVAVVLGAVFVALLVFALWFSQRDSGAEGAAEPPASSPTPDAAPVRQAPKTVFEAADVGDATALAAMLDQRPERIHLRDESGWTPLHHAAYRNHIDVLKLLIERGADPNAVAVGECVPIHMAATEGGAEAIAILASGGADLNTPDDTGVTALHYAALPGRLDVVEALIARGAAVNMKDAKQETPLDVARRLDDEDVAKMLETSGGRSGADVRMKDVLAALPDGPAKTQVPRAWHLEMESEPMMAAAARARETLPQFLAKVQEDGELLAAVKFPVRGEGIVEYVWGEIVEVGEPLRVTVTTPPVAVPPPADPTDVAHDDIVDWQLKLDEERVAGGYSQRATFEAIREEYGFLPADIEEELAHLVDL